jgi:hypothetical protein
VYTTVPYCAILYRTVPQFTALYRTVPYCTALYRTVPLFTALYRTVPHFTALYRTLQHCTALYHTVPYCAHRYLMTRFSSHLSRAALLSNSNRTCSYIAERTQSAVYNVRCLWLCRTKPYCNTHVLSWSVIFRVKTRRVSQAIVLRYREIEGQEQNVFSTFCTQYTPDFSEAEH